MFEARHASGIDVMRRGRRGPYRPPSLVAGG